MRGRVTRRSSWGERCVLVGEGRRGRGRRCSWNGGGGGSLEGEGGRPVGERPFLSLLFLLPLSQLHLYLIPARLS